MLPLTLAEIADAVGGSLHDVPDAAAVVAGPVVIDSRKVEPGGLFVAFAGEHTDGHRFAAAAIDAGAVAVLAARPVGVPALVVDDVLAALGRLAQAVVSRLEGATVIGVTGSSGKTSTKDLIAQVLARLGPTVANVGSLNNEIGLPLTVLRADAGTRYLVLEMGSRGKGHISYLTSLVPPRAGVVLNVGSAHVGEFGGADAIAEAKGELVECLPAGGLAVLNADDGRVAAMVERTRARVVTFGVNPDADVRAGNIRLDEAGRASFTLVASGGAAPVSLRVYGEHQVSNALAAAGVALGLGADVHAVAGALGEARALSGGRMEVTESPDGITVINDAYNANPHSMRAALNALAAMGSGRRTVAVLGEMAELGEDAAAEHATLGRLVAELNVGSLIAVGGHEAALLAEAAGAAGAGTVVDRARDRDEAFHLLREWLRPGDVVLVKASNSAGLQELARRLLQPGSAEQFQTT